MCTCVMVFNHILYLFRESTASVLEGSNSSDRGPDPVVVTASLLAAGCVVCMGVCGCRYYQGSNPAATSGDQTSQAKPKLQEQRGNDKGTTYESVEMGVFKDDPQVSCAVLGPWEPAVPLYLFITILY